MVTKQDLIDAVSFGQQNAGKGPFVTEEEYSSGKSGGKGVVVPGSSSTGLNSSSRSGSGGLTKADRRQREADRQAALAAQQAAQQKAAAEAEAKRQADIERQRQSTVGRGSGVHVANDTPEVYNQLSIQPYQKPTTSQRIWSAYYEARSGGLAAGVRSFFGSTAKAKEEEKKFQQQVSQKESEVVAIRDKTISTGPPGSDFSRGTQQGYRYEKISTEQLLLNAAAGSKVDLEAARQRIQSDIDKAAEREVQKQLDIDKKTLEAEARVSQDRINRGLSSVESETARLESVAKNLDEARASTVSEKLKPLAESGQSKLDRASKSGRAVRVAVNTAAAVGASLVVTPVVAGASRGTQIAAGVASGAIAAKEAQKVTYKVATRQAGLLDVAEFVGPLAGFALGAKIATPKGVSPTELNRAISESRLVPSGQPKIITTETQVSLLKIPKPQKAEILSKLRSGNKVSYQKYRLVNDNPVQQRILKENLPNTEITSVSVTNVNGRTILSQQIAEVKVGKGSKQYVELQTGTSVGVAKPSEGTAVLDTVSIRTIEKRPKRIIERYQDYAGGKETEVVDVSKARTALKTQETTLRDVSGNIRGREVSTESYTFKGKKLTPEQKITERKLLNLAKSDTFSKRPSSKSKFTETQLLAEGEINIKRLGRRRVTEQSEEVIKITDAEVMKATAGAKFLTTRVRGSAENIRPGSFEFRRKFKPFVESPKKVKIPKTNKKQEKVIKKIEDSTSLDYKGNQQISEYYGSGQYELTEGGLSPGTMVDLSGNVLSAVQQGAQILKPRTARTVVPGISDTEEVLRQFKNRTKDSNLQIDGLEEMDRRKERIKTVPPSFNNLPTKGKSKLDQRVSQRLNSRQVEQQKQLQKLVTSLNVSPRPPRNIPPTPKPPRLFFVPFGSSDKPSGSKSIPQLLRRKKVKRKPTYAASLAAAAVQAQPLKVTKKQYERLKRAIYSGVESRPVVAIIDDNLERSIKKAVQF